MEPRLAIPRWLGFSWWWLLIATSSLAVLSGLHHQLLAEALGCGVLLWLPTQATWLRRATPGSVAVFFLSAGTVGNIAENLISYLQKHDAWYAPVTPLSWLTFMLQMAGFAGLFLFAYELKAYMRRTEGSELLISYVWAFLLNIFYFQNKLHELYEDQLYREALKSTHTD